MSVLEPKDIAEVVDVADEAAYRQFAASNTGLALIPEEYGEKKEVLLQSDGGDFTKWLRAAHPHVSVVVQGQAPKLALRSGDYWLPLVFLASDIALPVYLNIVASYLYEKMKGALKGDSTRVHLSVVYEDKESGKVKRFNFEGDTEALQKAVKKLDLNKFLNK